MTNQQDELNLSLMLLRQRKANYEFKASIAKTKQERDNWLHRAAMEAKEEKGLLKFMKSKQVVDMQANAVDPSIEAMSEDELLAELLA